MNIILYTLPSCPICEMVKTKLKQKNILFQILPFQQVTDIIHSEQAPALEVKENNKSIYYTTPREIVNWINTYER